MTHTPRERAPHDTEPWSADRALEEVYATHYRALVRLSVLLVGDVETAEEVVQDCFVAMHRRWDSLREPERGVGYLHRSVVNQSRSVLRGRSVRRRHQPDRPSPLPGADVDALASERRTTVLSAMRQLPDRQREVLALRYYLDLSEDEIARTLRISRGSVKTHASRGAAALRRLLGSQTNDERPEARR